MSDSTTTTHDVLIVGGGLAGLLAGRTLMEKGHRVLILDKGRSVGGRMATRRIGTGLADHGAQFFTVRTARFQKLVEKWAAQDLVFEWARGWSNGSVDHTMSDGHPRYAARDGMNQLAKHLAKDLQARINTRVESASPTEHGWQLTTDTGKTFSARALLLTPPVPQSLAILDEGNTSLAEHNRDALEQIQYAPNVCGLFRIAGETTLPEPGAIQRPSAPITWMADNQMKGISEQPIITVHASPSYSQELWDKTDAAIQEAMTADVMAYIAPGAEIIDVQIKRWKYALPTQVYPDRSLVADGLPPLAFAGDGFDGPRVEGAVLSGITAGEALDRRLNEPT